MGYTQRKNEDRKAQEKTILIYSGMRLEGRRKIAKSSWWAVTAGFEPGTFCVGCEVLTAVAMKSTIFWDITPCTPL
jgi:hypothetical protein